MSNLVVIVCLSMWIAQSSHWLNQSFLEALAVKDSLDGFVAGGVDDIDNFCHDKWAKILPCICLLQLIVIPEKIFMVRLQIFKIDIILTAWRLTSTCFPYFEHDRSWRIEAFPAHSQDRSPCSISRHRAASMWSGDSAVPCWWEPIKDQFRLKCSTYFSIIILTTISNTIGVFAKASAHSILLSFHRQSSYCSVVEPFSIQRSPKHKKDLTQRSFGCRRSSMNLKFSGSSARVKIARHLKKKIQLRYCCWMF